MTPNGLNPSLLIFFFLAGPAGPSPAQKMLYARSGFARSAATRSDYYLPFPIILINGVNKTAFTDKKTLVIDNLLNEQVDTATLTVFGFDPLAGQTIIVASGAPDNRVFGGTILRAHQQSVRGYAKKIYDLECADWTWLLNKRRVFKTYPAGTSPSIAAADIVTTYAPTFGVTRIKGGAPALTGAKVFRGTPVMDALQELAQSCQWRTYPDYDKVVHFFDVETDQVPAALTATNYLFDQLDYQLDLSQIQTRVFGVGGGGQTTAAVTIGATTIPVNECGWYSGSGGTVLVGGDRITYTGVSTASGPGNITGVTGITTEILQGDTINVFVQKDDAGAQAALATLIGGGDDGIREGWIEDDRWSLATVTNQAEAQLAAFKNQDVRGSYVTYDKLTKAGKVVAIIIAARGISVNVTLQRVRRTLAAPNKWAFAADFSIVWSDLIDTLTRTVA